MLLHLSVLLQLFVTGCQDLIVSAGALSDKGAETSKWEHAEILRLGAVAFVQARQVCPEPAKHSSEKLLQGCTASP